MNWYKDSSAKDDSNYYEFALDKGATHDEAEEAHSKGINLFNYGVARLNGMDHKSILDVHSKGMPVSSYSEGIKAGATPNELEAAHKNGIDLMSYSSARRSGSSHDQVMDAKNKGMDIGQYSYALSRPGSRDNRQTHDEVIEQHSAGINPSTHQPYFSKKRYYADRHEAGAVTDFVSQHATQLLAGGLAADAIAGGMAVLKNHVIDPKRDKNRRDQQLQERAEQHQQSQESDENEDSTTTAGRYYAEKEEKKDSYKPPASVQAEARRALEWIKNGEAGEGFTDVGRKRASDLAAGRAVSLSTIKRMKSYLSRHGVDKQGEGWSKGSKGYPSPGRVAWAAWGGDAAKSWVNGILGESDSKEAKKKKKKNTDYEHMIKDRKGEPADKELYSKVKSEAKAKFDVYPSAVANAWVVKQYKKRGGTYTNGRSKKAAVTANCNPAYRSEDCPNCSIRVQASRQWYDQ